MEDPLIYIIRGLPHPFDKSIVEELAAHLRLRRDSPDLANPHSLMDKLENVSQVMIPMPEYDLGDFDLHGLENSIDLLASSEPKIWVQLLHALDDKHSPHWRELKELSPFKDDYLMFLDASFGAAGLEADLDDALAEEFLRRADAHPSPENCYGVVVPKAALDLMTFVSAVDDLPATI